MSFRVPTHTMPRFSLALYKGPLGMAIFNHSGGHVIAMTPSNINAIVAVVFQHTPVIQLRSGGWINIHQLVAELAKRRTLKGFGEEIGQHFLCWTVLDRNLLFGHLICHKNSVC